ncbi:unnamed protein product [Peronospora destructor]|uniref:Uncharacterized protein n=1 Tax=Peronospora destructor TaxID=86335 RepID=A0AAV0U7B5_9STRA|nr:unnamed protein product [Peronospora destructor]
MPVEIQRKLTVLGYPGVGKSSLTTCFVENRFVENYDPTIENTFHKTIRVRNAHFITDIVDTAGMDEYANFSQAASVGVHGYVLVYSIGLRTSFEKLKLINEKLLNMLGSKPPRVLVGSMSDLEKAREVSVEEGQMLASNWECPFVECSAKDNENINEVFTYLIKEIERDSGLLGESDESQCMIL